MFPTGVIFIVLGIVAFIQGIDNGGGFESPRTPTWFDYLLVWGGVGTAGLGLILTILGIVHFIQYVWSLI